MTEQLALSFDGLAPSRAVEATRPDPIRCAHHLYVGQCGHCAAGRHHRCAHNVGGLAPGGTKLMCCGYVWRCLCYRLDHQPDKADPVSTAP